MSTRRQHLQQLGAAAAGLVLPSMLHGCADDRRPPNIVVILADDLGSTDLGCYGADDLPTPHLDRLAASGIRFTQHYATAPVCTPSRASLLTGREPSRCLRSGVGLESDEVTLAEILRPAGYRTAIFGKWHLGSPEANDPLSQGFDEFFGFKVGAVDNYTHEYRWGDNPGHRLQINREAPRADGQYLPDLITQAAEAFIAGTTDRPFFLFLPYNQPHYPLQAPEAHHAAVAHIQDPARRAYAACVHVLDDCVGRVLRSLETHSLTQDTIVVFLSDHGHSVEAEAGGGGGRSTPYRGHKGTVLEGGIRVPAIASWPGHFPAGQTRTQMTSMMDWVPTLAGYAGLSPNNVDGASLDSVIRRDDVSPHDWLCWSWAAEWAVREGDWKLRGQGAAAPSLYDLTSDPGESEDLSDRQPAVLRRLVQVHDRWAQNLASDPTVLRESNL